MTLPALIASDVDGTLLDDDEKITPRTRKAVLAAVDSGAHFVLATGYKGPDHLLAQLFGADVAKRVGRCDILLQVRNLRRSWDRQHNRTALEYPRKGYLARRGTVRPCDLVKNRSFVGKLPCRQREPRNKADAMIGTVVQNIFARTVHEIIAVLHRSHFEDL